MTRSCSLCGGSLAPTLPSPDRRPGEGAEHEVWRCPTCGLGQTWPAIAPAALAAAYPSGYACYHQSSRPASGRRGRLVRSLLAAQGYSQPDALPLPRPLARALSRVRGWTWQPPPPPPGRLLDVGCGSGAYGASLIRLGWRVDGIEIDAGAATRASQAGLNVQTGAAETAALPAAAYDAITLWHTLEHLSEPLAALRRLRPALRPGGRLWVEVPNADGWAARATGAGWRHLDLPRHRFHFTPTSLRLILDLSGFDLLRLEHIPNPYGLAGAPACCQGQSRRRAALLLGWVLGLGAAVVGRADVIRVSAVPRP